MIASRPLLIILGPTASGKSALAIAIAQQAGGEIVCCDSTQIYRRFDIGTGKTLPAEQGGVPHHLIDVAEPDEVFTAGEYRRRAVEAIETISRREKRPILTVGTGLYLRALLEGLADAPLRSEELRLRLRETAAARGPDYLHRILTKLDPATALKIAPRDVQKIIRAIEICLLAREPASKVLSRGRNPLQKYDAVKIGLAPRRAELYERIDRRVWEMIRRGWIEEVKRLVAELPPEAKPFSFIGYPQLRAHLEERISLEQAVAEIQQATRRYAKRQITWFRRESGVLWFEGFGDDSTITRRVLEAIQKNAM